MSGERATPRVFVSSVIQGFESHREAARRGIIAAGGEPVMVNEDFPALVKTSRNACLDAVDSSDIYLALIGERGGWTAPSGMLVVEEEYLQAKKKNLTILVFLQDIGRDDEATRLARMMSDYIHGHFRIIYRNPEKLEREVKRSLEPIIKTMQKKPFSPSIIMSALESPVKLAEEASIRFAIAPDRNEEVIDPVQLEDNGFVHRIYAIGHQAHVGLFDYEEPKFNNHEKDSLVIVQNDQQHHKNGSSRVRLAVHESGLIIIDANVTGRRSMDDDHFGNMFQLGIDELSEALVSCFRFAGMLYDDADKHLRHQQFNYNVALHSLGMRSIVDVVREMQSYSPKMHRTEDLFVAHDIPRLISRQILASPEDEIKRTILFLKRKVN